jgi:putative Mg2+ transporter-C (MgtC) family protein
MADPRVAQIPQFSARSAALDFGAMHHHAQHVQCINVRNTPDASRSMPSGMISCIETIAQAHSGRRKRDNERAPGMDGVVSILVATFLGTLIGAEREWRRHPGGLRSCALVSAAACGFARIGILYGGSSPGAALGAIATGVGFLGAGVIMHQHTQITGLSMAATFWSVAAIGAACGAVDYPLAVGLTVVVFLAHVALRPLSTWIERKAPPEDPGPL